MMFARLIIMLIFRAMEIPAVQWTVAILAFGVGLPTMIYYAVTTGDPVLIGCTIFFGVLIVMLAVGIVVSRAMPDFDPTAPKQKKWTQTKVRKLR